MANYTRTSSMSLDPDTWFEQARARVDAVRLRPALDEIGRVKSVGDGIALIGGLPRVRLNELLRADKGQFGIAHTLERDTIGCVMLDEAETMEAGDLVRGTGDVVRVPVGPALLGRVVDPLGRALDNGQAVVAVAYEPIEQPAPDIIERDAVTEPVQTGILVIDFVVRTRPRPARAYHRRSRHRQDRDCGRHDYQSAVKRSDLCLCRSGSEVLDGGTGDRCRAPAWRARTLHLRGCARCRYARAAMDRAVRRSDHG